MLIPGRRTLIGRSHRKLLLTPVVALAVAAAAAPATALAGGGSARSFCKKTATTVDRGGKPAGAGTGHRIR